MAFVDAVKGKPYGFKVNNLWSSFHKHKKNKCKKKDSRGKKGSDSIIGMRFALSRAVSNNEVAVAARESQRYDPGDGCLYSRDVWNLFKKVKISSCLPFIFSNRKSSKSKALSLTVQSEELMTEMDDGETDDRDASLFSMTDVGDGVTYVLEGKLIQPVRPNSSNSNSPFSRLPPSDVFSNLSPKIILPDRRILDIDDEFSAGDTHSNRRSSSSIRLGVSPSLRSSQVECIFGARLK